MSGTLRGRVICRCFLAALFLLCACNGDGSGPSGAPAVPSQTPSLPPPDATATPTPTLATTSPTHTPTVAAPTPTPTLTDTAESGPLITYFGLVRADGCQIGCFDGICLCAVTPTPVFDSEGRQVFPAQGGGRGLLAIEGRPGESGFPPGIALQPGAPEERPDLQILSDRPLGNGSAEVCDEGPPPPQGTGGGIPAVNPADFRDGQDVTDALNDLSCRFAVQPSRDDACTLDSFGNFDFVAGDSTIQLCKQVAIIEAFPPGDTILTARLRDVLGNVGPVAQIVVRNGAGGASSALPE